MTDGTETFGLPPECSHLIAKLRNMAPEQLAAILPTFPGDKRGDSGPARPKGKAGTPRFPRDSGLLELRGEDLNLRPLG